MPRNSSNHQFGLLRPILATAWTVAVVWSVALWVDLTPQVEADFFFAPDDPQLRESRALEARFPTGDMVIVRIADSAGVADTFLPALTDSLRAIPGVLNVFSRSTEDPTSPLWSRILASEDTTAINVILQVENVDPTTFLDALEGRLEPLRSSGRTVVSSGVPIIVEQIRRSLRNDLVVFSSVALLLFGLATALIYRRAWVVVGTLLSCLAACGGTLLALRLAGVNVGLLTANIVTIVFVLTLSHTVFLVANWRTTPPPSATRTQHAIRATAAPSLWCMVTTALGFGSLWLTSARPLQELGTAGVLGTLLAFASAYTVLPAFLSVSQPPLQPHGGKPSLVTRLPWASRKGVGLFALLVVSLGTGILRLDTDPSLLSYFDPAGPIRPGLEAIDRDGGSSPLLIAVRDTAGGRLDSSEAYDRMWLVQNSMEEDSAVGVVLSPAPLIAHARTQPLAGFLPMPILIGLLDQPQFGAFTRSVMSEDKLEVLYSVRMRESFQRETRDEIMERITNRVRSHGFEVSGVGGLYELQNRLGHLIRQSLGLGLVGLLTLFVGIAWIVSRDAITTAWMSLSLTSIPFVVLGALAYGGIAIDIITSPAANVALAMGVDSLIHLVTRARRLAGHAANSYAPWERARQEVAGPVLIATSIIATGFAVFVLSSFPPTRRFGLAVVLGTATAALVALFILPALARRWPHISKERASVGT